MKHAMVLAAVAGCASSTIPAARFVNAPPVAIVNDRKDVPRVPEERVFLPNLYFFDVSVRGPLDSALSLRRARRALGVNALDEVPDSAWFTNRGHLTPLDFERGAVTHEPAVPWKIQSTKTGGTTIGFIVKDKEDVKYLLKFDTKGDPPELETATHVICNRLMWAAGFNVAEDQILYIHREDLLLDKGAKKKDELGKTLGLLTPADVDDVMKKVRVEDDGRIRVLASRWIDGQSIGGFPDHGTRYDDPNDVIPHELRRDIRGMRPIDAWLDAVDITEGQFVDSYVTEGGRHYVKHYAVDFGKSLGAMGVIAHDWWRGHSYRIDFPEMVSALFTFGFSDRRWEHRDGPEGMRGVSSLFDASIEPEQWHPDTPGFVAFRDADRFDQFWGAAIVAQFTPEQIYQAVAAGRLTDPRASQYLVDTLVARQQKLAAYWFARVQPIVHVAASGPGGMCFDDLAGPTAYVITAFDYDGRERGSQRVAGGRRTCVIDLPVAEEHDHYTIYRVTSQRGTTYIHEARDPVSNATRVVGLWRE